MSRRNRHETIRIVRNDKYIFLELPTEDGIQEFPNTYEGLQEAYRIITEHLGLSAVDIRDDEVVSFQKSARPVMGVNHR